MKLRLQSIDKESMTLGGFFVPTIISSWAIFQGDTTLAPPIVEKTLSLLNWICFIVLIFNFKSKKIINTGLLLASLFFFFLRNVYTAAGLSFKFSGVLMLLLLIVFCYYNPLQLNKLIQWFRKYMIMLSIIGIIVSLDYLIGFGLPHETVEYYGLNQSAFYVNYYFSYLYMQNDGIRLCGLFNEPGYMGTILGLIIAVEGFNFKRIGNVVLLIAGFFTLSVAFFVLLFVGLIIKSLSSRKFLIGFLLSLIIAYFSVDYFDKDNVVKDYIEMQTTYDKSSNSIGGHSREDDSFTKIYKNFNESGPILFGYGTGYCSMHGMQKTSSIRISFVEWGYIGSLIIYGLLLLTGFYATKKNKQALLFLFCFALSLYQRPNVFSSLYYLILMGGIYHIRIKDSMKINYLTKQ